MTLCSMMYLFTDFRFAAYTIIIHIIITNNVTYVHANHIFGDNFDANLLLDGVNPSKDVNHLTAEFINNLLSENLKPTTS